MECISIDSLPNEVLARILKQVADLPANPWESLEPFPVAASRLSRRWRALTLAFPELWTNIRISRDSRTRKLAAMFIKRSRSHPLDISINLECYTYPNGQPAFFPFSMVLSIVGPHVGRWRTIALRGWDSHLEELSRFLRHPPVPASQLEYAHLSLASNNYRFYFTPLELFGNETLRAVRLNSVCNLNGLSLRNLRSLDITMFVLQFDRQSALREILASAQCRLTALVFREFFPTRSPRAIKAHTIRSVAISFSENGFYSYGPDSLEAFTEVLSLPNLEYLEIVGEFSPCFPEIPDHIQVPEAWVVPPFPNLHTLRLHDICITPGRLTLLQILSREITELELINTSENQHLLHHDGDVDVPWPFLHSLRVETDDFPSWLPDFVAMRAALGPNMAIARLTLPLTPDLPSLPTLSGLCYWGTSRGLIDGFRRGFYVDDFDPQGIDFEYVEPGSRSYDYDDNESHDGRGLPFCFTCPACNCYQFEQEVQDAEIEEGFKTSAARSRVKGMWKEAKKERRESFKSVTISGRFRRRRSAKQRRSVVDVAEDFYVCVPKFKVTSKSGVVRGAFPRDFA
ncbi:hypothetical protein C8R44DRAFT_187147 [Mycena epipterygia]|nr:hypothetical protein C8R44DRAFT_187147 [Mycena epipterygia]